MDFTPQPSFRLFPIEHIFLPGGQTLLPLLKDLDVPLGRGLLWRIPTEICPGRLHRVQFLRNAHLNSNFLNDTVRPSNSPVNISRTGWPGPVRLGANDELSHDEERAKDARNWNRDVTALLVIGS